jgi:MFS family permease
VIFIVAFGGPYTGSTQFKLILLGGFFMNSIIGVIVGVVMDVIHPGIRSTGAAVLAAILNLFGLAVGPFLTGVLSDQWGLQHALAVVPLFSVFAAVLFVIAMRSYEADVARVSDVKLDVAPSVTVHLSTSAAT